MLNLGLFEIVIICGLALVFVGPERLPGMVRFVGKQYGRLMRASDELRRAFLMEAEREDAEKRAEALRKRREEARQRAEEARQRAIECFTTDRIVSQYEAVYERVLSLARCSRDPGSVTSMPEHRSYRRS